MTASGRASVNQQRVKIILVCSLYFRMVKFERLVACVCSSVFLWAHTWVSSMDFRVENDSIRMSLLLTLCSAFRGWLQNTFRGCVPGFFLSPTNSDRSTNGWLLSPSLIQFTSMYHACGREVDWIMQLNSPHESIINIETLEGARKNLRKPDEKENVVECMGRKLLVYLAWPSESKSLVCCLLNAILIANAVILRSNKEFIGLPWNTLTPSKMVGSRYLAKQSSKVLQSVNKSWVSCHDNMQHSVTVSSRTFEFQKHAFERNLLKSFLLCLGKKYIIVMLAIPISWWGSKRILLRRNFADIVTRNHGYAFPNSTPW